MEPAKCGCATAHAMPCPALTHVLTRRRSRYHRRLGDMGPPPPRPPPLELSLWPPGPRAVATAPPSVVEAAIATAPPSVVEAALAAVIFRVLELAAEGLLDTQHG